MFPSLQELVHELRVTGYVADSVATTSVRGSTTSRLRPCCPRPAITALGKGYDTYVAVDASGTFSETKRQAGLLRMQQAGVILSDYATLMVEILKDNASPLAGPVYDALDMPWATLVGQIAKAYGK